MESTVTVLAAGSKRATIVTSLRCPPALASLPNALTWVAFETNDRESEPTSRRLNGLPGRRRGDQVLGVDLLDLVEAVGGVDVEPADADGGQHDDEGQCVE